MSRRIVSYALIVVFVLSVFQYAYASQVSFPDLGNNHWAYSAVAALVTDGTVKGFEDGSFKPDNTVSRAEFVKMIGKGTVKKSKEFSDVSLTHWAYDYIMYSELSGSGSSFNPDTAITRNDVLNLIWNRNGSKTDVVAPSVISKQGTNKDAVAWGYINGIMVGDDGLDLRLNDTLSRAEAAVLIVRARGVGESTSKKDFVDTVSPKVLENIYKSIKLFDNMDYSQDRTITYGEMSRAVLRLSLEEFNLTYKGYSPNPSFSHKYADDLYIVGTEIIGAEKITAEYADKPATVQDTLAALTYNFIKKSRTIAEYGNTGNYYKDIASVEGRMLDICLTYCFENGVQLYSDGSIKPQKAITLKEFSALLLQLDSLIGSQSEITTQFVNSFRVAKNSSVRKSVDGYPANYEAYQCILDSVPNIVYATPFADNFKNKQPKTSYDFSREYSSIFVGFLDSFKKSIEKNSDAKIILTYYPSLVCEDRKSVV